MNVYDMRESCKVKPLCYDFYQATKFFNDKNVMKELGVDGTKSWASCNMKVNMLFRADFMINYHQLIPEMLEDGIKVFSDMLEQISLHPKVEINAFIYL